MKSKKQIRILIGILVVLVGIIILLLMRSCQKQPEGPNKVLAPDYPSMDVDKMPTRYPTTNLPRPMCPRAADR